MGLQIKTYSYSYLTLQVLRQKSLECEGNFCNIEDFYDREIPDEVEGKFWDIEDFCTRGFLPKTKFKEFLFHSDCEGLYISKSSKQYEKIKKKTLNQYGTLFCYFGDLDILKIEVQELNTYMLNNLNNGYKKAWIDFYNDVMKARKILYFR